MNPSLENLDFTKRTGGTTSSVEPGSLPGILPTIPKGAMDADNIRVRYQKLNLDDPGDIIELERIETMAIRNRGIYLLSKKDFVFMDKMFILISYLEETKA